MEISFDDLEAGGTDSVSVLLSRNYGCTHMSGDLIIEGDVNEIFEGFDSTIGSNPFEYLVSIEGNLIIRDTDLTTLSYFDGLKKVGGMEIRDNPDLECETLYFPLFLLGLKLLTTILIS